MLIFQGVDLVFVAFSDRLYALLDELLRVHLQLLQLPSVSIIQLVYLGGVALEQVRYFGLL